MNRNDTSNFDQTYYDESIEHRNLHKCGGYPYSNGSFLTTVAEELRATTVLEIGTAIGYSAYCFARGNSLEVTTIDLLQEHKDLAISKWKELDVDGQIKGLVGNSKDILPNLEGKFDIVFFDGFAPNPSEIPEYVSHLNTGGLLISTNLSWNTTSEEYLSEINDCGLNTVRNYDTSLSSSCNETLTIAQNTWNECEADTKKRGAHL